MSEAAREGRRGRVVGVSFGRWVPRLPVDICRFDIIRREDVHMSTVWPFLIKTVKLSPKTAVDSNRAGVHTALGPQRGFNFGLLADP